MRKLKEDLAAVCTDEEISQLIGGYDIIGDVAIIIIPEVLVHKERMIGEALLTAHPRLRIAAKRDGLYGGEFRIVPLKVIAGGGGTETEVSEFGVRLRLDPAKVYFSVRSGNERHRVASLVGPGEEVLVMFSGVAPFPLQIGKFSKAAKILGIEKNPLAHNYGCTNLQLNRKIRNITLRCGDVRDELAGCQQRFDRIVMPAPTLAGEYLHDALAVLKPGGWLHYYAMQPEESFALAVEDINSACLPSGRILKSSKIVRCGHCSPKVYRICVDACIG